MDSLSDRLDTLVRHDAFVRRLARRLVVDAATADDVAQEALRAAIERPPRASTNWEAWFTVVVRRLVSRSRRTAARRERGERPAAQSKTDVEPSAAEHFAREAERRLPVEAVFALRAPLRDAVLLRY
jgi:DNA-directed RNA polymerase specialized sigma24 family protein